MRLNFTGRRKIDKQHARVAFCDDPVGSKRGHYFDLKLDLGGYRLPPDARVFVEAYRGLILMRFDLGTIGTPTALAPADRRLLDFAPDPDGVKLRLKVVQPDGTEMGKLLAEADGLVPAGSGGVFPLIRIAGDDKLGATPWRLELVPSDPDLPTLWIHTALGGKSYANDRIAKPLLITAVVREVFAALVWAGDHEGEDDHWAFLWSTFATEVLGQPKPPDAEEESEEAVSQWVESAVNAFASKQDLVNAMTAEMLRRELEEVS